MFERIRSIISVDEMISLNHHYNGGMQISIPLKDKGYIERYLIRDYLFNSCSKLPYVISLNKNIKQSGVYVIFNTGTGDFYIGSSGNVAYRVKDHRNRLNANIHTSASLQKTFNESNKVLFDVCIIFTTDREEAYSVEQFFIDYLKDSNGFLNIALDVRKPQLGRQVNPHQKETLLRNMQNRTFNSEVRKRMSIAQLNSSKARKTFQQNKEASKKRIIIEGVSYESITHASMILKIPFATLHNRITSDSPKFIEYNYSQ